MAEDSVPDGRVSDDPKPVSGLVVQGSVWTLFGTIASAPLSFVTTLLLARFLDVPEFGRLAYLSFIISLVTGVGALGLTSVIERRVALAEGRGAGASPENAARAQMLITSVQMIVVLTVSAFVFHGWVPILLIATGALATILWTPSAVLLTGLNRSAVTAKVVLVATILSAASQIVAAKLGGRADLTFAAGYFASSVTCILLIWVGIASPGSLLRFRWDPLSRAEWRFALMGLANGQLATLVFSRSELLFFPPRLADARGHFAAASTIGARASIALDALFGAVPMALTTLRGRGGEAYRAGVDSVFRISSVLFSLSFPPLIVIATAVTPYLFPPSYGDLRVAVMILVTISLLQTAAQPATAAWIAEGVADPMLIAGIIGGVLDIILSATLIPRFGLFGAVFASSVSGVAYLIWILLKFRGRISSGSYTRYLALTIGGCVTGAAGCTPLLLFKSHGFIAALIMAPLSLLVGILFVRVFKPLRERELVIILSREGRSPIRRMMRPVLAIAVGGNRLRQVLP